MVNSIAKENLKKLNLNKLYQDARTSSTVTSYNNPPLVEAFKDLVVHNEHNLSANFMPYGLYQNEGQIYGLIHVDYLESDGLFHIDIPELSKKEGAYLHEQLKQSCLPIDYLFIMPYYNYIDRTKGSFLSEPVVTNENSEND